ncbi:hypothetical protein AB0F07_40835 [Streptomyces fructofermentans]|uniref:hypothetical protein n=1 Tax=Streptomyces fructofermentans TaxID=152141 RepID=UPI0033E6C798
MSELIVKNANLKPAVEQMLSVAEEIIGIMDRLQDRTAAHRNAGGNDPAGQQFHKQFDPGTRNVIEALKKFAEGVEGTADNLGTLSGVLVKTEGEAQGQAHQLASGPKPKR